MEDTKIEYYAFICVWCGVHSDSRPSNHACSAPDGDGHLFKRTKIEEIIYEGEK